MRIGIENHCSKPTCSDWSSIHWDYYLHVIKHLNALQYVFLDSTQSFENLEGIIWM